MIEHMLENAEVHLNVDYLAERDVLSNQAKKIVYCGAIDEYYGYCYGCLEYRGLRFDTKIFDGDNFQGNAVINYTDRETPYTRVIDTGTLRGVAGIRPWSPMNIPKIGTKATSHITRSTTNTIPNCIIDTRSWPPRKGPSSSVEGWVNTDMPIWIKSFVRRWNWPYLNWGGKSCEIERRRRGR